MVKTFRCKHCDRQQPANPRLKDAQQYCNLSDCQRARKAAWIKLKRATDRDYHDDLNDYLKQWRQNKPASSYMRHYRQQHPDYVKSNRIQQRLRNQQRRAEARANKIVKVDALLVELQAYHGDSEALAMNST